ncbi:MBL fold metallo-hydrolase [Actinokineospora inagensis]|uniref:MBL fold metallo-hydrolase n=1 Tax=Actinokineospora inagensis TaxID=103730 RepID=UPI00041488F9|nr:MBL fold metallo-hydrolase [Actinokineospora inagensis]
MKLTLFGHACVLVETGAARVLVDPGMFSPGFEDLRDLDAVLITHQHFDHFDPNRLPGLMAANQHAELVVDPGTAVEVEKLGLRERVVHSGDSLPIGGSVLSVVGGEHAVIHQDIPVIPNVGYLIDHGAFYYPGDSFVVPEQKVDVLALPTGAPWLKLGEAIDYFRAVAPRVAVPVHDLTLAEGMREGSYERFQELGPAGARVEVPGRGNSIEFN